MSIDVTYNNLIKKILNEGRQKNDRTGTGTISIPFATIEHNMVDGFPLLTCKRIHTRAIVHELLWFLNGGTNIQYLEQNGVSIWTSDAYREYVKKVGHNPDDVLTKENFAAAIRKNDDFAKRFGELGPVYGQQWRHWNYLMWSKTDKIDSTGNHILQWNLKGIDQIQQVIDKLINNPDDRRIMVSAWNVDEIDHMALPPCHYGFQLYSEELSLDERIGYLLSNFIDGSSMNDMNDEDRSIYLDSISVPKRNLSLIWDQRSCDTFLGIPFNIASYGILLHMFAQQANMIPNRLIGSLKNVHIYNNHKDQCLEQISRKPRSLPKLVLHKAPDIFSYKFEDIQFVNYLPHDKIAGDISV